MKTRLLTFIATALFALALFPAPASAQTCSVSGSTGTVGTASTACFVRSGNTLNFSLTGTWVGTVDLQKSVNNGLSWTNVRTFTANAADLTAPDTRDVRFRFLLRAYTSGSVVYSIRDVTYTYGRVKYSTVPIGSVAYGSFGITIIGAATSTAVADVFVQQPMLATGIGILVGSTGGTDKFIGSLYDSAGRLIISTDTAGTTVSSSTNAFQQIAFSPGPRLLPAGRYFISVQINGTTAHFRRVAVSTFVDVVCGSVTSSTFGTIPTSITAPTSCTAEQGPIAYIY